MEKDAHADVLRLCEEADFPVAEARKENGVLILVPERLDQLPGSERLRRLSERIQQLGYRHVAFAVEPEE